MCARHCDPTSSAAIFTKFLTYFCERGFPFDKNCLILWRALLSLSREEARGLLVPLAGAVALAPVPGVLAVAVALALLSVCAAWFWSNEMAYMPATLRFRYSAAAGDIKALCQSRTSLQGNVASCCRSHRSPLPWKLSGESAVLWSCRCVRFSVVQMAVDATVDWGPTRR